MESIIDNWSNCHPTFEESCTYSVIVLKPCVGFWYGYLNKMVLLRSIKNNISGPKLNYFRQKYLFIKYLFSCLMFHIYEQKSYTLRRKLASWYKQLRQSYFLYLILISWLSKASIINCLTLWALEQPGCKLTYNKTCSDHSNDQIRDNLNM